jgi:hypothetical protein
VEIRREHLAGIVGVCVDPINSGRVVYVPLEELRKTIGTVDSNILLVELETSADRAAIIGRANIGVQKIVVLLIS